jgi:radical SAM protein with 4Fe4S-binding SPASM domain
MGIDVSDACNIACKVCSREVDWDKRDTAILSFDRFRHIYDQVKPLYLSLSGYGETLLNKRLPDMIAHATASGSMVNLVSNGTLLDGDRASRLLDAGLARLKVSIDAATPERYAQVREGGELEVVLRNIEKLLLMRDARRLPGPVVEVQCTIFKENIDEVQALVDLCVDRLGVEPYFHVMFTYGEQEGFVARTLDMGDADAIATLRRAADHARSRKLVRTSSALDVARRQLETDLSSAPCYIPWYSCIVSTDGDVYPCCYHSIRGTKVGNVLHTPFAEIWNGPAMAAFRRQLRTQRCADRVCATCRYEDAPMERVFSLVERLPGMAARRA